MEGVRGGHLQECGQLIALIDDIMKLSRLDEGSEELSAERVDLYDLSQKILQELTPVGREAGNFPAHGRGAPDDPGGVADSP